VREPQREFYLGNRALCVPMSTGAKALLEWRREKVEPGPSAPPRCSRSRASARHLRGRGRRLAARISWSSLRPTERPTAAAGVGHYTRVQSGKRWEQQIYPRLVKKRSFVERVGQEGPLLFLRGQPYIGNPEVFPFRTSTRKTRRIGLAETWLWPATSNCSTHIRPDGRPVGRRPGPGGGRFSSSRPIRTPRRQISGGIGFGLVHPRRTKHGPC